MYKLCTTPADATLPIYKLSVPFSDKKTPEDWIKFQCGLHAMLKVQNVTQGPASYAVIKTLLKGDALMVFEQAWRGSARVSREGWAGPGALHAEELTFWQRNYREGMGGSSFGAEQVPQGFPLAQQKQHTAT
eukprot:10334013-Ditylum_brightwellii.AAC.1